jgi:hypothetical protein
MELSLYLQTTYTEYPPLFVTAANAFDAVDLYRDHFAIGAFESDDAETVVEVYKVPPMASHPMAHPLDHSTVTGGCRPDRFAVYRIAHLTGTEVPF